MSNFWAFYFIIMAFYVTILVIMACFKCQIRKGLCQKTFYVKFMIYQSVAIFICGGKVTSITKSVKWMQMQIMSIRSW